MIDNAYEAIRMVVAIYIFTSIVFPVWAIPAECRRIRTSSAMFRRVSASNDGLVYFVSTVARALCHWYIFIVSSFVFNRVSITVIAAVSTRNSISQDAIKTAAFACSVVSPIVGMISTIFFRFYDVQTLTAIIALLISTYATTFAAWITRPGSDFWFAVYPLVFVACFVVSSVVRRIKWSSRNRRGQIPDAAEYIHWYGYIMMATAFTFICFDYYLESSRAETDKHISYYLYKSDPVDVIACITSVCVFVYMQWFSSFICSRLMRTPSVGFSDPRAPDEHDEIILLPRMAHTNTQESGQPVFEVGNESDGGDEEHGDTGDGKPEVNQEDEAKEDTVKTDE